MVAKYHLEVPLILDVNTHHDTIEAEDCPMCSLRLIWLSFWKLLSSVDSSLIEGSHPISPPDKVSGPAHREHMCPSLLCPTPSPLLSCTSFVHQEVDRRTSWTTYLTPNKVARPAVLESPCLTSDHHLTARCTLLCPLKIRRPQCREVHAFD